MKKSYKYYHNGSLLLGKPFKNGYCGVKKCFCEMCGLRDEKLLIIHHKKQVFRRNKEKQHWDNSPENLMVLCYNCHFKIHNYKWYKK
jgi:hypothetical protein